MTGNLFLPFDSWYGDVLRQIWVCFPISTCTSICAKYWCHIWQYHIWETLQNILQTQQCWSPTVTDRHTRLYSCQLDCTCTFIYGILTSLWQNEHGPDSIHKVTVKVSHNLPVQRSSIMKTRNTNGILQKGIKYIHIESTKLTIGKSMDPWEKPRHSIDQEPVAVKSIITGLFYMMRWFS